MVLDFVGKTLVCLVHFRLVSRRKKQAAHQECDEVLKLVNF